MSGEERELHIRNALIDNYNNYAQGLDSKNWPLVRACFADDVLIDYGDIGSATGQPGVARRTDDWMVHLKSVINGFDITRHTITNHRVTTAGGEICCRAYLTADHVIFANNQSNVVGSDDVVTVVGEYTNRYQYSSEGWQIIASALAVNWSRGNLGLFALATERAALSTD